MKRLFSCLVMALAILIPATNSFAVQAADKNQEKSARKAAKQEAKKQSKEGWKLNEIGSMEDFFYGMLIKTVTYGGDNLQYVGNSNNKKRISNAISSAIPAAIEQFVSEDRMAIKGRFVDKYSDLDETEKNELVQAFEGRVAAEVKGDLKRQFVLVKENKNGTFNVKVYYLVAENAAKRAYQRALENLAEEDKIEFEIANEISDWINNND